VRNQRHLIKRLAYLGVCTSIALVLAWVESLIPPLYAAIPGIKLGLPNIAILFILYRYSVWDAAAVSFVRIVIVALLFGNPMTFAYSLAGAALSLLGMALLKRVRFFSTVGVSVVGAVLHNVGQVLAAVILLETTMLWYYLIVLLLTGTASGIFVGLCGGFAVKRFHSKNL
jgi:heptaprenyl diphosphate synthase